MNTAKIPPISIEAKLYERFKVITKNEKVSISEAIRNMIEKKVDEEQKIREEFWDDFKSKYVSSFKSEVNSTNYKKYLYGENDNS